MLIDMMKDKVKTVLTDELDSFENLLKILNSERDNLIKV